MNRLETAANVVVEPARDSALWEELTQRREGGVFQSRPWLDVLHETYGFEPQAFMLLDEAGSARAGLVAVRVDDLRGGRLIGLPFSDYCDPLVADQAEFEVLAGTLDADVPVRLRSLRHPAVPASGGWRVSGRAHWHAVDLTPGADEIWNGFTVSARGPVRQALAKGVTVRATSAAEDVRAFFEMHLGVRKRKYRLLAQPYRFFEAIRERFLEPGDGTLLLAELDGGAIGGVLLLAWRKRLYYKFNASRPGELQARPNDLLMWRAIVHGCEHGLTELDLGLTDWDQAGLIRYKEKYASRSGVISTLVREPTLPALQAPGATEAGAMLGDLTRLLTEESVPDEVSERAGALLYRHFA